MEMQQVRYFLAVAEELNFTKAAEKCNVAQPSLTRAIKQLEEELGGTLFHRERANTHLTELGRMVQPHLQQVYDESHAVKRLAQDFTRLKKTPLKLGVMCTIAPTQLIELVSTIHDSYPGVEIELTDASAGELVAKLVNGDLEVAILCPPGNEPDDRLHMMPLFREQMMIVVHPGHRLANNNAIQLKDLDGERYLNRAKCEFNGYAGKRFLEYGVRWNLVYRSERDDWILSMIAAGMGFGFMPENTVSHPGVIARPLIDPEFWRDVSLATVRSRPHSPAVGALVREAMRVKWHGQPALAVKAARAS